MRPWLLTLALALIASLVLVCCAGDPSTHEPIRYIPLNRMT